MDHDDVNSSDIEYAPTANEFAGAGAQSVELMLERAVENRLESKKAAKQLQFVQNSKKTMYINYLWYNRFLAFRRGTLRIPDSAVPIGEHLERFLRSIVSSVVPRLGDVPSYRWLHQGVGHLVNAIVFHYKDFTLSSHERSRIACTLNDLFHAGKLTKDVARAKHFVGAFLVRKLSLALFTDALRNGTVNWDITMAKALSMVLVAAIAARTGDVTKAPLEVHKLPFLCFKDITLKLVDGNSLSHLEAKVLIRNEKGDKGAGHRNRTVNLEVLRNPKDNVICPIKILLILALRLGNVSAATTDQVLQGAASRRDKTVQWTHPYRPVLCAFLHNSSVLTDKPAGNHQLSNTMRTIAPRAGFIAELRAHDLRRGAARDAANLNKPITGHATQAVAASLGHSENSHARGVTAKYVGSIAEAVWTKRVEEDIRDSFEDDGTAESFVGKRRMLLPSQITQLCGEAHLDPSIPSNRRKAARWQREEAVKDWARGAVNAASAIKDTAPLTAEKALAEHTQSMINARPRGGEPSKKKLKRKRKASEGEKEEDDDDDAGAEMEDLGGLFIDPRLLTGALDFDALEKEDIDRDHQHPRAAVADAYVNEMLSSAPEEAGPPELRIGGVDFVRLFSEINVSANQTLAMPGHAAKKAALIASAYSGHSRGPLSLWLFSCENVEFGCPYKSSFKSAVFEHERSCKIISPEVFEKVYGAKEYRCAECPKSFDQKGQLDKHATAVHKWTPVACKKDGCDPTSLFQTRASWGTHARKFHTGWTWSKCQYPGCASTVEFGSLQTYRKHLNTHGLREREQKDKHMPGAWKLSRKGESSPVE